MSTWFSAAAPPLDKISVGDAERATEHSVQADTEIRTIFLGQGLRQEARQVARDDHFTGLRSDRFHGIL
jgi:hypothetical protein